METLIDYKNIRDENNGIDLRTKEKSFYKMQIAVTNFREFLN